MLEGAELCQYSGYQGPITGGHRVPLVPLLYDSPLMPSIISPMFIDFLNGKC